MIATLLATAGIEIFKDLISNNGEDLVKKGIEKVTGLKLDGKKALTIEEVQLINDSKIEILKLDFEMLKLEQEKFKTSHETYRQSHTMADKIASSVIKWNLPIIFLLVISNLFIIDLFKDNAPLMAIASNIIGIAIGKLFTERQAVINFFFGSSIGSKDKDVHIQQMKGK